MKKTEDYTKDRQDKGVKQRKFIIETDWESTKQCQKLLLWFDHMRRMMREFLVMKKDIEGRKRKTVKKAMEY